MRHFRDFPSSVARPCRFMPIPSRWKSSICWPAPAVCAGLPPIVYDKNDTPGTNEALASVVVLPWNEKYRPEHVELIARVMRAAAEELSQ